MPNNPTTRNQRQSRSSWIVVIDGVIRQERLRVQDVFSLDAGRRVIPEWNEEDQPQPIGESGGLIAGVLGSIASNFDQILLTFESWHDIPDLLKFEIYNDTIKAKFVVDDAAQKWYILQNLGKKWSDNKSRLFRQCYDWRLSFQQNCERKHPPLIHHNDWVTFLNHKTSEKSLNLSQTNRANRGKQIISHSLGSKSIARKRAELEKKEGRCLSRVEMYQVAHKRKDGAYVNAEAQQKAEQLHKEIQDGCPENEAFIRVFGKEHPGRVRGIGAGVTPSRFLYGSSTRAPQFQKTQSEIVALKAQVEAEKEARKVEREENKIIQEAMMKKIDFLMQCMPRRNHGVDSESPEPFRRSSASSWVPRVDRAGSSDASV